MDPGIVTAERQSYRGGMAANVIKPEHLLAPTVTCRQCRVQLSLDDMETHECDPRDLKAATQPSPRASTAIEVAAARATSFLDSFLDTPPPTTTPRKASDSADTVVLRAVEVTQTSPAPPPPVVEPQRVAYQQPPTPPLPPQLASLPPRSMSMIPPAVTIPSTATAAPPSSSITPTAAAIAQGRPRSLSSQEASAPIQCRVRGVRLNKDKVALYSIVSNILQGNTITPTSPRGQEIIVERRYREFYAFAQNVYAMFPSPELWARLPPKTLCIRSNTRSDGFLLRRKNGLDDFIRCALEMMDLGSNAQGSIGQWYLVRKFLNLPPTLTPTATTVSKDRSLVAAMNELKKHARQRDGWTPVGRVDEHDTTFEKTSDGFQMVKRVKTCPFPARAVFDMINKRSTGISIGPASPVAPTTPLASESAGAGDETEAQEPLATSPAPQPSVTTPSTAPCWDPLVESIEIIRRENRQTWTERTIFKGRWIRRNMEMISIKSWKVDETGTIMIVMIPADDAEWRDPVRLENGTTQQYNRVDCVLGGWVITPVPGEETCTVTWLMQANFGECDPQSEFTTSQGLTAFVARNFLLSWADEIVHLISALEPTYDPTYYRNLGPLLSGGDLQKVKLQRRDSTTRSEREDPRIYVLAHEMEPQMCLLIHKNTNTNVLIFKTNQKTKMHLDPGNPLRAEWIMFEKTGNPRQDLSTIERTTTYGYSTKHIGPNVFQFTLDLIRRDCVLRNDPVHGYGFFTTINGKPNVLLKRVYLTYGKSSRMSFSKMDEIVLYGITETETISLTK